MQSNKEKFWDPRMSKELNEAIDEYNAKCGGSGNTLSYHSIALYQRKKMTPQSIQKLINKNVIEKDGKLFLE